MRLCVDPGHGWGNRAAGVYDPGACSGGYSEAAIAMDWALAGKFVAHEYGVEVFLTRTGDRDPAPVGSRASRATAAGCTHYVSIHCNCATGTATGTEVYYRDDPDLALANKALSAAIKALGLRNRGAKPEGESQHPHLAVLNFAPPACLVELGFIDNPTDRREMLRREARIAFWESFFEDGFGLAKTDG